VAHFTLSLDPVGGAVISAYVGVSEPRRLALAAEGQEVPREIPVRALIDTGASCTCVDPEPLRKLELPATGNVPVHTPSSGADMHFADAFDVSMWVPAATAEHPALLIPALPVLSSDLSVQGIHAIIGRDVLSHCLLVYNGSDETFTVAF
jgi:hypothetical protein